jgi:hypothetical protein
MEYPLRRSLPGHKGCSSRGHSRTPDGAIVVAKQIPYVNERAREQDRTHDLHDRQRSRFDLNSCRGRPFRASDGSSSRPSRNCAHGTSILSAPRKAKRRALPTLISRAQSCPSVSDPTQSTLSCDKNLRERRAEPLARPRGANLEMRNASEHSNGRPHIGGAPAPSPAPGNRP